MDTIAHGLTGAVIGYCGFRQYRPKLTENAPSTPAARREPRPPNDPSDAGRSALWAAIAAAEFPDIDILLAPLGSETYFRWHRSFTHSALLLPFWAVLVAVVFWSISGRRNFRVLFTASAAGLASHLAMDWITNYGTMLFWPLSDARLALSWVFILDPYVWAALGLTLWAVSRTHGPAQARAARVGLAMVCGYILMCGECHWLALRAAARPPDTQKLEAFAQPLSPFRWTILRQAAGQIHWINGGENRTFVQFHDDRLLPQAEATPAVKLFRWLAEFPLVEMQTENSRTVLRYRDLRFRTPMPWGEINEGTFVGSVVEFDRNGDLLSSRWVRELR